MTRSSLREDQLTLALTRRDIEEGVTLDFDAKGHLVGLEVLDASERMGLSNLVNVSIENLPLDRVPLEAA